MSEMSTTEAEAVLVEAVDGLVDLHFRSTRSANLMRSMMDRIGANMQAVAMLAYMDNSIAAAYQLAEHGDTKRALAQVQQRIAADITKTVRKVR